MPGPVTDDRAHELRRRYLDAFGGDQLPVPVAAIAEDLLGLDIDELELDGVSGMLVPAERRVYVNASDIAQRRRFTLAHEVGHWVCQCVDGRGAPLMCRAEEVSLDPAVKALEREANVFAAELLMPEEAVRSAWAGSIPESAERFGVSEEAMHWRLYNFRLVTEPPA